MDTINRYPATMPTRTTAQTGLYPTARATPQRSAAAAQIAPVTDRVTLSAEERARAKEEAAKRQLQEQANQQRMLREQLESADEQAETARKKSEEQLKCMTIASRIMAGDTVPPADYRYLAKNNSELYAQAITLRVNRSDPRKYKRLSEEEKTEDVAQLSADAATDDQPDGPDAPASPDAPPAAEGGEGGTAE